MKDRQTLEATCRRILLQGNIQNKEMHRDRRQTGCCQGLEERDRVRLLNGYGVSFGGGRNVLSLTPSGGCMELCV
jgi:hypothetical protein